MPSRQNRTPCLQPKADAEFYAAILEQVAHPIFIKDRQLRYVLMNEAFCAMIGRSREEVMGKTDHNIFSKTEADRFYEKDLETFESVRSVKVDGELVSAASKTRRILSITRIPLRSSSGEVTHLVGIIHDITRLKEVEEALRQANEQLEKRVGERTAALAAAQEELVRKERLAMLGQLAGGLAHQIRNPLASITNAAYLLQKALNSNKAASADMNGPVAIIVEEAWKANRIISGLLDHARVRTPMRYPTNVVRMVRMALASRADAKGIKVVEVLPEVPEVAVDPNQVQEALGNLVQNAIEAMADGGTLTLELKTDGDGVIVAVSDTGPGIPPEVQRLLFRPLVTTKQHGLGLGLTTAQMLIGNQGGNIAFRSQPGQGARFEVWLPIAGNQKLPRTARG